MRRTALGLLLLLASTTAFALRTDDLTVVVPIIGRFAGVPPSVWRTDVFLANPFSPVNVVTMRFYVSGGATLQQSVTLQPFATATLHDIVLNTFGQTTAAGVLELTGTNTFEARARIYNVGSSVGEFGQAVPGIGKVNLRIQAFMHGLSGINGNRVNAGVTNPNGAATTVQLLIADKNNVLLHVHSFPLGPHANVQFNDIFATFSIAPQEGISINFTTGDGTVIYGYASEVRNDSGDAIFVFGSSPNS
jgi:hypothetical protein